jgi:LPPG:FO 2-phospho-L-lactate transferase
MRIALLAGGTGGAKLAAGMQDLLGSDLSVIANTADDTRVHGLHVSPDPDLITYWLSGEIDEERGWGIKGDSFAAHERLVELGAPGWLQLTDRDLATCLYRTHFLAEGGTVTAAQGQIARALGVRAAVLPMCEQSVHTRVRTPAGWHGLQEYLIVEGSRPPIEGIEVQGLERAVPSPEVSEALTGAEAVVIGPSNPVISIGPILAVPGLREALTIAPAPVVAVSPLVGGQVLKGPTDAFMQWAGNPLDAGGVAAGYAGLIDGLVTDERTDAVPVLQTDVLLDTPEARRRVADETLAFADAIAS